MNRVGFSHPVNRECIFHPLKSNLIQNICLKPENIRYRFTEHVYIRSHGLIVIRKSLNESMWSDP